ncbi:PREDICTED: clusterin-associated protein 1 [Polistes dominula]|uniref:Clusterin-associated protein 1 n=1 Tax=Polistes dominula TaxID=743375 RepID=A0ABM1IW24_POLDO|nr:PREDICTED: clusterin-associated protein 1 [Polistes dominula]XP_015184412.1 PREDICTED: clusterin-associated protein 1 [Polistes dominula]XP_015184413.1 PREDICTED: clusterin-associated protein 1 [Polistes dominula]
MSFRELRNFTETMRVLGYPRLISIANFRSPNFPLVAEILVWLVKRFDPDVDITSEHNTEEERIFLIRSVAEFMALNTNVKLNTKKLYQADGYAVQELLKITNLLHEAQNRGSENINYNDNRKIVEFNISDEINELKSTRQLASLLTVNGATLFDLLGREVELRDVRNNKAGRQFDTAEIENVLKDVIENMRKEIEDTKKQIDNVKDTEQSLDTRIERRRSELERNQKRLQALRKVRPAFMEEYEKLEAELRILYDDYLQKFRYLSYLEHLHEDAAKAEQERIEKRQAETKRKLEQLRSEDLSFESMVEGNDLVFGAGLQESPLILGEVEKQNRENTIQPSSRAKADIEKTSRTQMSQRRIYGSMSGRQRGTILETNDSAGSLDSDSDLLIDGDLDDDDDDDEDDDDLLNSVRGTDIGNYERKVVGQDKRSVSKLDHSDEDF